MVMAPVSRQAGVAAQQSQAPMPSRFRQMTRQQLVYMPSMSITNFGQVVNQNLPQSGFLANIYLYMTGTITTGAGTPAGSWAAYPFLPFNLLRRIRVFTSEQVEIVNLNGWSLAFKNQFERRNSAYSFDLVTGVNVAGTQTTTYYNATGQKVLLQTNTGTPAAATAYTFSATWKIPIMTDDATMLGLILLQSLEIRATLELTFCQSGDTGNVSGVSLTPSFTVYPEVEFYSVPDSTQDYPNLDWVHIHSEEYFPFTTNGDIIYRPQIGNVYMSLSGIVENNGAQVAPAYAGNSNVGITAVSFKYAQAVVPYYYQYIQHLAKLKWDYGIIPPDGSFIMDFTLGSGVPEVLEPRDLVNSSQQTDIQIVVNVAGLVLSSAQLRVIKEQLAPIA